MKFCWVHLLCHNGEWNKQRMNLLPSDAPFSLRGVLVKHSCDSGLSVALPFLTRIKWSWCPLSCGAYSFLEMEGKVLTWKTSFSALIRYLSPSSLWHFQHYSRQLFQVFIYFYLLILLRPMLYSIWNPVQGTV